MSGVRVSPSHVGPSCKLNVDVTSGKAGWKGTLAAQILADDGKKAVTPVHRRKISIGPGKLTEEFTIDGITAAGAKLWWPEDPVMHRVVVWLEDKGDETKVLNVREETFGFRDVAVKGGKFFLNGRRMALMGYTGVWSYSNHEFMRKAKALRNHQVLLFRAMNGNAFRSHQDPLARTWLDLCDREGILVVCEFSHFPDMQRLPKWSLNSPYDRPRFVKNLYRDIRGVMHNRFNHPSIIMWSATNEGNGLVLINLEVNIF